MAYGALRERLRFSLHARARARYRAIWRTLAWSLAGVTSLTVQGQGLTLLFGLLAGPAAYAPIAATLVLYAPLRIPTSGADEHGPAGDQPAARRRRDRRPRAAS